MKKAPKFFFLMTILIPAIATRTQAQHNEDAILGKWINEDKTRVIEFVKAGNSFDAVIRKAPDKSLVGKNQLTGITHSDNMYNGSVMFPKKEKSYPCTLRIKTDGSMELTAKAGFVSKSQIWTKVQ